jgi:hypothetical protein
MSDWLEDLETDDVTIDRTSRALQTREKQSRKLEWKPPSSLDAPPAPAGYHHRWIREEIAGQIDAKNVAARLREGFELVRADEYPDFEAPVVESGRYEGVIGVGGLLLARIPEELVKQRQQYYRSRVEGQMEAVDNDMLRENQHSTMRITKPERQSRVSFGGGRR